MRLHRRFSFRLRTLLLAVTLLAVVLGWRHRPRHIEIGVGAGMTAHYTLRRAWDGRTCISGPLTVTYANGRKALACASKDMGVSDPRDPFILTAGDVSYWSEDGAPFESYYDWINYQYDRYGVEMHPLPECWSCIPADDQLKVYHLARLRRISRD